MNGDGAFVDDIFGALRRPRRAFGVSIVVGDGYGIVDGVEFASFGEELGASPCRWRSQTAHSRGDHVFIVQTAPHSGEQFCIRDDAIADEVCLSPFGDIAAR